MARSHPFRPPRPRRATCVTLAALLAVAAGCSSGEGDGESARPSETTVDADADLVAGAASTTTGAPADGTTPTTPTTVASTPAASGDADCADEQAWGTDARGDDTMTVDDVYLVRTGRHDCYDRVVFDVNGVVDGPAAVGFHVAYADGEVAADASGEPVPTAGDAAFEVVVRAPALGYGTSGHQPGRVLGRVGDDLVTSDQVAGWPSLREVTFAGSFEGQTTFAVGVDQRRPFRAGAYEADGYTHVYVDIAHAP